MGPPIQIFLTSIASAPALRQRQEQLLRVLQVKKIPYTSYDLASDEEAKKMWRRKAPANNSGLPGILVGGEFPGSYGEFEEAVEFGELDRFFKLNEPWGEDDEALAPASIPQKPIGIPGAATPNQMTGQRPSFSPSPSKPPKKSTNRTKSIDVGTELGFGLEGVKVSEEEMLELVESLGLGGQDADDLVKGLGLASSKSEKATLGDTRATSASQPAAATNPSSITEALVAAAQADPSVTSPKVGEPSSANGGTQLSKPSSGAVSGDAKAASNSVVPNTDPQAGEAVVKGAPTSEPNTKAPQTNIPESALTAKPPGDGTELPSATDGEKSAVHPPLPGNVAPDVPPESRVQPKEEQ